EFFEPALDCAVRYDRMTGYFAARALTIAARGIEGLVRNRGRMRLVVGCTLEQAEVSAIDQGQKLRETVEAHLLRAPLVPGRSVEADALELLAWMVANGFLDVKVAIPCDNRRRPVAAGAIFHSKSGIIEDKTGDRLAFTGSVNETEAGWLYNAESFHVFS